VKHRVRNLLLAAATVLPIASHAAEPATTFNVGQIDSLLAPVALFPDQLLAPMLVASSEPLQIVLAARWLSRPENAVLRGDALDRALDGGQWSPCVRALIAVPPANESGINFSWLSVNVSEQ
jgi:hypothetical protein